VSFRDTDRNRILRALSGALDLKAIALALLVLESGTFRLAARRAGLTVPSLSRRIRALEDAIGVSLFERRSSGVRVTEAGRRFLDAVARSLGEIERATVLARKAGSASVGTLVIATYFSASAGRLRDTLARFVSAHPDVSVAFMEGDRAAILQAVRQGTADLALVLGPREEHGLEKLPLWSEAALIAVPLTHPLADDVRGLVSWAELAAETFVVMRCGSGPEARERIEELLPPSHAARFSEQVIGRETMFNLVGTGLGVAVLAESSSGAAYPGVVFRPVGDEGGPTMVEAAAYWDPKRDNPALRRFLAQLRATQGSRGG
jgi:DNA-binding transcriptional LysR family regulator